MSAIVRMLSAERFRLMEKSIHGKWDGPSDVDRSTGHIAHRLYPCIISLVWIQQWSVRIRKGYGCSESPETSSLNMDRLMFSFPGTALNITAGLSFMNSSMSFVCSLATMIVDVMDNVLKRNGMDMSFGKVVNDLFSLNLKYDRELEEESFSGPSELVDSSVCG